MEPDQLKQLNIEGCEFIGRVTHASVYRIAPDEIVKVYREDIFKWADNSESLIGKAAADKIRQLIREVPDSKKLLHGDFHLKNIIICKGRPMLIDMDTLCFGDPVFDLATIANSYLTFPKIAPEAATVHLGISVEDAGYIWKRTLSSYYEDSSHEELSQIEHKAISLGLLRIIDFAQRNGSPEQRGLMIKKGLELLDEALN